VSWRKQRILEPLFGGEEIRTGDDQFSPLQFSPLSSKEKFAA